MDRKVSRSLALRWVAAVIRVVSVCSLGRLSGAGCIKYRVVKTDVCGLPIDPELNGKATGAGVDMNAVNACLVPAVPLLVSSVFHLTDISEIFYTVISRVAIYVVDCLVCEFAVMVKPCKPMALPYLSKDADAQVSTLVVMTNLLPNFPSWKLGPELISTSLLEAREYPGFRVIMNVFFKLFLGDHFGTLVKAVEGMRQPLTGWWFGSYPSRELSLTTSIENRQSLLRK